MVRPWEQRVLEYLVEHLDPGAVGGGTINSAGLDSRLFDAKPGSHPAVAQDLRELLELLTQSARDAGRLPADKALVVKWRLKWDIYSPELGRLIEVDERQHFSRVRLRRLLVSRNCAWGPLYPDHFWQEVFPRRQDKPAFDLDPPHRDEQRAYLDEVRDRLPVLYGLRRTIRLDVFTLKHHGIGEVRDLIAQALRAEADA
jgi:hypothetical protein